MEEGVVREDGEGENWLAKEAVRAYLKCGSLAQVARELDTTVYELQKLAKTQWWTEELGSLRRVEQAALDESLSAILGKTLTEMVERLEFGEKMFNKNGVPVLDAEGKHVRKPVAAAVLVRIAETVFDKRQLLRGLPTALSNESTKLQELAEKLEKLGRAQSMKTLEMEADAGGESDSL